MEWRTTAAQVLGTSNHGFVRVLLSMQRQGGAAVGAPEIGADGEGEYGGRLDDLARGVGAQRVLDGERSACGGRRYGRGGLRRLGW